MFQQPFTRRVFLKAAGATVAGAVLGASGQPTLAAQPAQTAIPRWRGFNLTDFFQALDQGERAAGMVSEDDLKWIRDWGFDFIRIPMDYWLWIDSDWRKTKKLSPDDIRERAFWDDYQKAYELAIRKTAAKHAPWVVAPADRKWFTRLVISAALVKTLEDIDPQYPTLGEEGQAMLRECREALAAEDIGGKPESDEDEE